MNKTPLVSIIIPCYNHENFLDDCLSSVMAQDYDNIELLICDDASPDLSFEKIVSYRDALEKRFKRVEILRNETNCGVTKNVNRMLTIAKGEFVKTLASDDCMATNAISEMVAYLLTHDEIDVVICNGITVLESEKYPDFMPQGQIYETPPDFSPENLFVRTAQCNRISAPAAMVRMSVYERFGCYDENLKVEDYEFWLRIIINGNCRFGFLDKRLIYYRLNANSMTSTVGNSMLAKRRKIFHSSEMATLLKFKNAFSPSVYAEIAAGRILQEFYFAVQNGLCGWDNELKQSFQNFKEKKDLPFGIRLKYECIYIKQCIKKRMKK